MPTIWDIDQLRPLQAIGRRHTVAFTLRGGVAFRFALQLNDDGELNESPLDLFALAPFTADVDLVHSGPAEKTGPLLDAILTDVPSAECFRWELRSESEDRTFQDALMRGSVIPARLLGLSENPAMGLIDPANGYVDIQSRRFRYHRNPLFRLSPFFQSGRDLEVFSALLYLQTLFEARLPGPEQGQPGWNDVATVFAVSADRETRQQLEQHAYLRSRLRYLLVNAMASHRSRAGFRQVAQSIGLRTFVRAVAGPGNPVQIDSTLFHFLTDDSEPAPFVLVSSARLGGDTLRLPLTSNEWLFPAGISLPQLGANQEVLLVSPELEFEPGASPSSRAVPLELKPTVSPSSRAVPLGSQEFIYFELPVSTLQNTSLQNRPGIKDEDLSGFLMLRKPKDPDWAPFALPCIVERQPSGAAPSDLKMTIRINCLGLLETVASSTPIRARIGLLAWTGGEA